MMIQTQIYQHKWDQKLKVPFHNKQGLHPGDLSGAAEASRYLR